MTQENYEKLNDREKMIYNEFIEFTKNLAQRVESLTLAVKRLLEVATEDP